MLDRAGQDGIAAQFKSAQARYAAHAAKTCGYAFRSLDGADGYLFEVRDGDRRAVFAAGAGTPYALNDAATKLSAPKCCVAPVWRCFRARCSSSPNAGPR